MEGFSQEGKGPGRPWSVEVRHLVVGVPHGVISGGVRGVSRSESQPLVFQAGEDGELTLADRPFLQIGKPRLGGAGSPVLQRALGQSRAQIRIAQVPPVPEALHGS